MKPSALREDRRVDRRGSVLRRQLPGLFLGGCDAPDEIEVFRELCEIVESVVADIVREGRPLPPPTAGRDYANKMHNVA